MGGCLVEGEGRLEGVLRDEGRSGEAVRDAMGWIRFGLVVCARKADSGLAYLPQDLQGYQVRFLDRIMGWVSLVAHGGRAC